MKPLPLPRVAALLLALASPSACALAPQSALPVAATPVAEDLVVVQPGAPGEATRTLDPTALSTPALPFTEADVGFMQGMIPHHAQALDMGALVAERTASEDIRLLARRIEISQKDEIAMMRRWLEARGQQVPGEHAHHTMGDDALMPGMLTAADMAKLAATRGADFDRLFLESMIRHHQGALTMVSQLFASPGAGQESEMYFFASHVDADQQIEIMRMRRMLAGR